LGGTKPFDTDMDWKRVVEVAELVCSDDSAVRIVRYLQEVLTEKVFGQPFSKGGGMTRTLPTRQLMVWLMVWPLVVTLAWGFCSNEP
jgi:hypothetical protein